MPRAITAPASEPASFWDLVRDLFRTPQPVSSETGLAILLEDGLALQTFERLIQLGFQRQEIFDLVIPQRTLTHRKNRRQKLSLDESDRAVRLARTTAMAIQVFANREKAWRWLRKPNWTLGDKTPLELLTTETGARAVEEALIRIDEGMFV